MKVRVKVLRAEHDMTQEQLAQAIGVSRNTINSIETGRYVPSVVTALRIAEHFRVPLETLFQLERGDRP